MDCEKFCLRFDVEARDVVVQRIGDLVSRFAHTGKRTFRRITAGGDDSIKFSAGDDVKSGTFFSENSENRQIRIRFNRIAYFTVEWLQCAIQSTIMIKNSLLAIHVQRRSMSLSQRGEISRFAIEFALLIMKRMHGEERLPLARITPKSLEISNLAIKQTRKLLFNSLLTHIDRIDFSKRVIYAVSPRSRSDVGKPISRFA